VLEVAALGKLAMFAVGAAGEWLVSTGLDAAKEAEVRARVVHGAVAGALDEVAQTYTQQVAALLAANAWAGTVVSLQVARCIPGATTEPDWQALASEWHSAVGLPREEAERVAAGFLAAVRARLKQEPFFFQETALEALEELTTRAQNIDASTQLLLERLRWLDSMVNGRLRTYLDRVADAGQPTTGWRRAAEAWMRTKLRDAIPADWFGKALDRAIADNRSGYVHLVGEPGVGKSTLAAQVVATRACPFHWNDRRGGYTTAGEFGACLGRQLVARGLLETQPGPPADRDATSIAGLFELAATLASSASPLLVVVDALDEAAAPLSGGTPLSLPDVLPDHVFAVVTTRPHSWLPMSNTIETIDLDRDWRHQAVLKTFIWERAKSPAFAPVLATLTVPRQEFVDEIYARACGSFIYARCVLDDLQQGRMSATTLNAIPSGLTAYYDKYVARVLDDPMLHPSIATMYALCVARVAVAFDDLVAILAAHRAPAEVSGDLDVWRQYVESENVDGELVHRVFHPSFADHLLSTDVIARLRPYLRGLDDVIEERIQEHQLSIVHRGEH
jgi:hypothetical protein